MPPTADLEAEPTPAEVVVERVETPGDEVILRDGSFARGSVSELSKGSHVTIKIGEQQRRIEWAELERVRIGTAQPAAAEPIAAPVSTDDDSPADEESERIAGPRVYLESLNGRSLTLYRISEEFTGRGNGVRLTGISYRSVCSGSCGRRVDGWSGGEFFVGGQGVTASRRFTLLEGGEITLEVKGGSRAARIVGWVSTSISPIFLISGVATLAGGSDESLLRRVGTGLTLVGVGSLALGIVLLLVGRTKVRRRQGR